MPYRHQRDKNRNSSGRYWKLKAKGICVRCGKNRRQKSNVMCVSCYAKKHERQREYRKENPEKIRKMRQDYYRNNKEYWDDYQARYQRQKREEAIAKGLCSVCFKAEPEEGRRICATCTERNTAYRNKYKNVETARRRERRRNNPEKYRAVVRKYRRNNREKLQKQKREWARKNRDILNERRNRKRQNQNAQSARQIKVIANSLGESSFTVVRTPDRNIGTFVPKETLEELQVLRATYDEELDREMANTDRGRFRVIGGPVYEGNWANVRLGMVSSYPTLDFTEATPL